MNEQLEFDVRTALQERASLVPHRSVARLAGLEYHPRVSRFRPRIAIGATALTTAAAAGAAAVVVSLGAGASNAFAGWTSKPTQPAPGQIEAASAACQASQSPVAGLPLKLSDTRGPFTFSIYADNQTSATCIKGPSLTAVSTSGSSAPVSVPADRIDASVHRSDRGGSVFSFADGRIGSDVAGVTLTLDDGTTVQATVGNGWFVAWWPADHGVQSAQITTPAGVKTQTFDFPHGSVPAGGTSSSGSMAGGSKGPHQTVGSFSVSP
jgi:hypothetical protein